MTSFAYRLAACCFVFGACAAAGDEKPAQPVGAGRSTVFNFDEVVAGASPDGWSVGTTRPEGPDATWQIKPDGAAPSGGQVLSLVSTNHRSGSAFNLCWTRGVPFRDGVVEVRVRADRGEEDQGGGPMWRVLDANNYYLARYNPLEENFRLYVVRDGRRRQLADAGGLLVKSGEWFTIRVSHVGQTIDCRLNGQDLLHAVDGTLADVGGVGVWTKADAATSFDDLVLSKAWASDAPP